MITGSCEETKNVIYPETQDLSSEIDKERYLVCEYGSPHIHVLRKDRLPFIRPESGGSNFRLKDDSSSHVHTDFS